MRRGFVLVLVVSLQTAVHAQDVETLISESDPAIQGQINRIYDVFRRAARDDLKTNCDAFDELQRLKDMTDDKGEIVKQLALFAATTDSAEDAHVMLTGSILEYLNLPASIPIRVLAPYLDADDRQLRDFARGWFFNHDGHGRTQSRSPLGPTNYYDYMQYVRSRLNKNEEIPIPFIKYLYEEQPDKAILVFAYANRQAVGAGQLAILRDVFDARLQGRELESHEMRQLRSEKRQQELRQQLAKEEQSEILLAEHIVSNAIWLKENVFNDRFKKALPEVNAELAKLAKHDQWWVRLYVAVIMRRHRELQQDEVIAMLSKDSDPLVAKAAEQMNRPATD